MKKTFTKIFAFALIISLVTGIFTGLTISVEATGADSNGIVLSRALSDEGIVLLKNEGNALPLKEGANIAIFGEGQHSRLYTAADFNHDNSMGVESLQKQHGYIPWGAGSSRAFGASGRNGAIDPLDAFNYAEKMGRITVYDAISQGYIDALENSNSDESFVEYIPTQEDYQAAVDAGVDTAILVISRFDGECVDLPVDEWSLSESEKLVLQNATKYFDKVIVVLNTPTPIDTSWAFDNDLGIEVDAILFAGYGGMQGGYAIADVVLGDVNPSGKLVTTYAKDLYDYPTTESFINDSSIQRYTEDIFLGYRYFETFDPEYTKVNFEFGFGLSYTTFDISTSDFSVADGVVSVKATVKNTGSVAGKEVVQMYLSAPQGKLGKAAKVLCAFGKTDILQPGESQIITLTAELNDLASYDDNGKTGHKSAYVLEAGDYKFFVGNSVREAGKRLAGTHNIASLIVVEQLTEQAKTNLDKRLLADGTFENLNSESGQPTATPTTTAVPNEKVHNIGSALRIESEDWYEKPYSTNASYTGSTEKFTGVLYNKLTNNWKSYTGTVFAQSYMIKSVTYKVTADIAGEYKISVRYASNANSSAKIPTISVATSTDNVTFGDEKRFTCIKTDTIGGSPYSSYKDSNAVSIILNEGVNYIKINLLGGSPNVDSFYIYYAEAGVPAVDGMIFEAEDYIASENVTTADFSGWYYNGETATEYSDKSVQAINGSVTYKLNVINTGIYKITARCASMGGSGSSGLNVLTSTDGVTFTNPASSGDIVLSENTDTTAGKEGETSFVDVAVDGYVYFEKGTNYIKFEKGSVTPCDIDFFILEEAIAEENIEFEAEEYMTVNASNSSLIDSTTSGKVLYNEITGKWESYKAKNLQNTWAIKEATYQVYVSAPGRYSFKVIAATNDKREGSVHLTSEYDNFTEKASAIITDTYTESGNRYHGYKTVAATGTITLEKGINTLKLTFGGGPNVDKIILVKEDDAPVRPLKDVVSGAITLDEFVNQMTNTELASFFVSYPGLNFGGSDEVNEKYGFSRVTVSDGPSGIGSKASSFPCETVIACTWNTKLVEAFGRVMGKECYDNEVEVWLAPGVNLHRNPLSGRNSEYYSEDPFLSGIMAVTTITAVQRYGVSVCIKHFVCNEKEDNKLSQDVRVSERALREIYLKPFEMAVKDAKAQGIMSSYNLVNGVAMNENKDILTNILRGEWGYQYYISGDWNNNKDMIKEINAGHGVREPYTYCDIDKVIAAIEAGQIDRETLLTGAKYILNTVMKGKRNYAYSKYTGGVCGTNHKYENDICIKCNAPDPKVFANLNATVAELADYMINSVGLKVTVQESALESTSGTIIKGHFTNNINAFNAEKTRAEFTVYNTMNSKTDLRVKMGIYAPDSAWSRVMNDTSYSFSGDEGVYKKDGWLIVPYGCQATIWCDLSNIKYDTFAGKDRTYLRSEYKNLIYFYAPNAQASDAFYIKGDNVYSLAASQIGANVEGVQNDPVFKRFGDYNIVSRLEGDYGVILDSSLLTDAGLKADAGKFFEEKVDATYILRATDNEDYIFKGWYDKNNNLISTEKLVAYNTIDIDAGKHTVYANYVIKDAKAATNVIKGATLDIGSSLTINYFAELDENHKDARLLVTHNDKTTEISGTYNEEKEMYMFSYKGISAQCMTDELRAELVLDGEVLSVKENYSVKAYANDIINMTAEELKITDAKYAALKIFLSDMLVYGDAAQEYRKYKTDILATEGINWLTPSSFAAPVDCVKRIVSGNTDEDNKIKSAGVHIANVNKIYFKVNVTDAEVYVDGKLVKPDKNGKVYTDDITATGFNEIHTIELKKSVDTIAKFEYNVNAYINAVSENATVGDIVKALNNYGVAAKTYLATN